MYYWVPCAINKGGIFEIAFVVVDTYLPRFEALDYILPYFDALINSSSDTCILGVHLSNVLLGSVILYS